MSGQFDVGTQARLFQPFAIKGLWSLEEACCGVPDTFGKNPPNPTAPAHPALIPSPKSPADAPLDSTKCTNRFEEMRVV